jgi:hypothetical protein
VWEKRDVVLTRVTFGFTRQEERVAGRQVPGRCAHGVRRHQDRRDVRPVREPALVTFVDTAIGSAARHELLSRTEALDLLDGVRRAVRDTASESAVASIVNTALAESVGKPTIDRSRVLDALLDIRRIASTLQADASHAK